ncbi:MAG: phycobilisome rod-core linker polypeptide CpcG, partial [Vulcanococcus sp.]
MALPLLKYAPTTQNSRVNALRVGSDEDPKAVSMDKAMDREDQNFVIEAAYRQIFFHAFKVDRDRTL